MIPFPPVVEYEHEEAFISKHPRETLKPHGLSVPWMAGLTSDEGAMKSARMYSMKSTNKLEIKQI